MTCALLTDALRQFPEGLCEADSLIAMTNLATFLAHVEGRQYEVRCGDAIPGFTKPFFWYLKKKFKPKN